MDALILFCIGGIIALGVPYLAYAVYDYLRFEKLWKARSRCPGCGRWRYEVCHSYVYDKYIFECRKCRMTWIDGPRE